MKENALVALNNLLELVTDDYTLAPSDPKLQHAEDKAEQIVDRGKALMQSDMSKSIVFTVPELIVFFESIENTLRVSFHGIESKSEPF